MTKERLPARTYRDLLAWQKAFQLVVDVYAVTKHFPESEKFGLTAQLRRAAVSIPSNIAEGYGRNRRGEYIQFLGIARGSLFELETQLLLAKALGCSSDLAQVIALAAEVGRILTALKLSLEGTSVAEDRSEYGAVNVQSSKQFNFNGTLDPQPQLVGHYRLSGNASKWISKFDHQGVGVPATFEMTSLI